MSSVEVSVLMPCLNEAETVGVCVARARQWLVEAGVTGEVVVADNGSTDGSPALATAAGARVLSVAQRGYGAAIFAGSEAAAGRYIIVGDADDSYDFSALSPFLDALRAGADLVVGNRFRGGIAPGAMPFLNRYLGNPVLTLIGRVLTGSPLGDFHCGLRGYSGEAFRRMDLRTMGMEFASEMIMKATHFGMNVVEVPTTLRPAGRSRPPHLRPWSDGWRHLRFMLLYSPAWLFLYPGLVLIAIGLLAGGAVIGGPLEIRGRVFDVHTLVYASCAVLVGWKAVIFAVLSSIFAMNQGLRREEPVMRRVAGILTLERGLLAGLGLVVAGLGFALSSLWIWGAHSFGPLVPAETMRVVIPGVTVLMLGCDTILGSFFLSTLHLSNSIRVKS